MKRLFFPGSFDPITLGHLDIIKRARVISDELIIGIGENSDKKCLYSLEERINFISKSINPKSNVKIMSYKGLTSDFCLKIKASAIIRGIRSFKDFEYEKDIAEINRKLIGIETLFFLSDSKYSFISSSIVRELISNKGDYSLFVPNAVKNSR